MRPHRGRMLQAPLHLRQRPSRRAVRIVAARLSSSPARTIKAISCGIFCNGMLCGGGCSARRATRFPCLTAQRVSSGRGSYREKFVSAPTRSLTDIRLDHQIIGGEFATTYRLAKTRKLSPRRTRRPQDRPSPTPRPSPPTAQIDVSGVKTSGHSPVSSPPRQLFHDGQQTQTSVPRSLKHPPLAAKPAETDKSIRPSYRRLGDS